MLRSMMVLPIIRIIGLTIPLMQIPTIILVPYHSCTTICSCLYYNEKSQGLTRKHVGLVWGNKKVQFLVALTGMFLGTIEYTILKPLPLIACF